MTRLFNLGLAARVMLGAFVFIGLASAVSVRFIVDAQRRAYIDDRGESLGNRAERSAERLVLDIDSLRRDVLFLCQVPPVQGIIRAVRGAGFDAQGRVRVDFWEERLQELFSAFAHTNRTYAQIRYIGVAGNGRELVRVDSRDGQAVVTPPEKLQGKGDRDYFQATLKLKAGAVYLSEIDLNRERGEVQVPHVRTLRAAAPVFAADGELFGMVVINMDVGPAIDSAAANLAPGIRGYLMNSEGDYLAHPDPGHTFGFDLGRRYTRQQDMPGLQVPSAPGGALQRLQAVPGPQGLQHVAVQRLQFDPERPGRFLLLAYALPDTAVQAYVAGVRNATMAGTSAIALLLGAVVYVLLRRAFAPLTRLTVLARSIGAGDYDVRLPEDAAGEMGTFVRAFGGMLKGISAREREVKEANAALRASEERATLVVETTPDGILVADAAGRIVSANSHVAVTFGYSKDELLGQPVEKLIPERLRRHYETLRVAYVEQPDSPAMGAGQELSGLHRGGHEFPVEVALSPLRTDGSLHVVLCIRDITERKAAEESLRKSEAHLRTVVENLVEGVAVSDLNGQLLHFNRAATEMHGFASPEEYLRRLPEFTDTFELSSLDGTVFPLEQWPLARILRGETLRDLEVSIRRLRTGWRRTFSYGGALVRGADGEPLMAVVTMRDITERQQAQEALRISEERLRLMTASVKDYAIIMLDPEGHIATWNEGARRLNGYAESEILGESMDRFYPPEDVVAGKRAELLRRAEAEGRCEDEGWRVRKDGTRFEADVVLTALRQATGELVGFAEITRDVTERREAERRIRAQVEHLGLLDQITRAIGERQDLKSIFQVVVGSLEDSLPLSFGCVCLYDQPAGVLRVASVGSKSQALGQELAMTEQASIDLDQNGLSRCVQGGLVYEPDIGQTAFPFTQRLARGGQRSLVLAPLRSESGVFGVLVAARRERGGFTSVECEFLRQVSEHVGLAAHQAQLYGALQQAYDDLRQTQQAVMQQERLRALGQMASGIAHDINNAISPAALYTESLLETEQGLSDRARGYLETIQRAVEDVAQTVARMREFYRQREPQLTLVPVDVNRVVRQVVDLTRARWSDMPQQMGVVIQVLTELTPDLPRIMGVESEIREALTNLVFNAVDAMPGGGTLTLRTRLADSPGRSDRSSVLIEVADDGAGMDEDTRRRCLEPFFTTKGERGTGLGLAMVFGAVQRHSADIEIESAPGAGTTVRLGFQVPATVLAEPGPVGGRDEASPRLRLLLIDDDPVFLKSLRDTLEASGHVITTANAGQAGIDTLRASLDRGEAFAAVITDLGMPHVDGRRVAAAVKAASPFTPVILLTGWGQRLVSEGDIPPHVDRVLSKPPKLSDLREALADCCRPPRPGPSA